MEQGYDDGKAFVSKNSLFAEEFSLNIKNYFMLIEPKIGDSAELNARQRIVDICALYVLYYSLFRIVDKKFLKTLWDVYKKLPAIHLVGNVLWFPCEFLMLKIPPMINNIDRKTQEMVKSQRQLYLQQKSQSLPKDVQTLYLQVASWMIKMDSSLADVEKLFGDLNRKCTLLVQGLMLAWNISHQVKTITNLHVTLSKPMVKSSVLALFKMVEMLKAIEATFHRQSILICESITHVVQHLSYIALVAINQAKKKIISDKKYSERHLDVLSALLLAEKSLNGPGTKERRLITNLVMSLGIQMVKIHKILNNKLKFLLII